MSQKSTTPKPHAPTLYLIIFFKVLKGLSLVALAVIIYRASEGDLPEEFRHIVRFFHLDPERQFFVKLTTKLDAIEPRHVVWAAAGTGIYGIFLLLEGIGLYFRAWWAGWLVIASSLFFVPIEVYDLLNRFTLWVLILTVINLGVVWYLYQNRNRLFPKG